MASTVQHGQSVLAVEAGGAAMSSTKREMLRAERADFREFVATLTSEEWAAPSLCAGWTVRDVVVHLTGTTTTSVRMMLRNGPGMVTNFRGVIDRGNADRISESADLSREEVLAAYDASMRVERPYDRLDDMPWFGKIYIQYTPVQALADTVIHHQDIRRPLGYPRAIPPERIEASLQRVIASRWVFGGSGRAKGLRLEAHDVDFAHGKGPRVGGTGEALLLALSGRPAALDDLDGDGLATLRARVRG
jgi:uncharacterized protein (TIGR03083 family)